MGDVGEDAFTTLLLMDYDARAGRAPLAGQRLDEFHRKFWERLAAHEEFGIEKIDRTVLEEDISQGYRITGKDQITEIWIEQPVGLNSESRQYQVRGLAVDEQRNLDRLVVRYRKVGDEIRQVELVGTDLHSLPPEAGSNPAGHYTSKEDLVSVWEKRFKERFPKAKIVPRFRKTDQVFWRKLLGRIREIDSELDVAIKAEDAAKAGVADEELTAESKAVTERLLLDLDADAPEATKLFSAAMFGKGIQVIGKTAGFTVAAIQGASIALNMYHSPTFRELFSAARRGDTKEVEHYAKLVKEYTRPDVLPVLDSFIHLGQGVLDSALFYKGWPAFVDELVKTLQSQVDRAEPESRKIIKRERDEAAESR